MRHIYLMGEITPDSANKTVKELLQYQEMSSDPIHFFINSNGGDLDSTLMIYDIIKVTQIVNTYCLAEASSGAAILLMSGNGRYCYSHSKIMLHSLQVSVSGAVDRVEEEVKKMQQDNHHLMEIISKETGKTLKKVKKDCKKDFYLNATQALTYGVVDQIIA